MYHRAAIEINTKHFDTSKMARQVPIGWQGTTNLAAKRSEWHSGTEVALDARMALAFATRFAALAPAVALAAVWALPGCSQVVSPKPEPPANEPTVNPEGLIGHLSTNGPDPVGISGDPGAVKPAGATVRVYNLDTADLPVQTTVASDGSFFAQIALNPGNELRVELVADGVRSKPLDLTIATADKTQPVVSVRPLADCLILEPALELDAARTGAIHVHNGCSVDVQIVAPTVRLPINGVSIGASGSWPAQLAPSTDLDVTVVFRPSDGTTEEIVFVEASGPQHDRRPITVFGATP